MRISGNVPAISASQTAGTAGNEILDELMPGDALQAEVISTKDESLALRLSDGTTVNARRAAQGGNLTPGVRLAFTVLSKAGGLLTVELTDPSLGTKGLNTEALLRAFGAEVTPENREAVLEMVKSGITPSKQSFSAMTGLMQAHPTLEPKQAAFMLAQKMPVSEQNVEGFQEFLRKGNQIGAKLTELLSILEDSLPTEEPAPEHALTRPQEVLQEAGALPVRGQGSDRPEAAKPEPGLVPERVPQGEVKVAVQEPLPSAVMSDEPEVPAVQDQTPQEEGAQPKAPAETQQGPQTAKAPAEQPAREDVQASQTRENPELADKPTLAMPQEVQEKETPPINPERGREAAASLKPPEGALAQKTGDVKEMIRSLFREIDPERADSLPKELSAQRFLQELEEVIHEIREKSGALTSETRNLISNAVKDIQQGMNLLEQLNRYTSMVQIPVMINGERTTAELYVFNDGQKGKKRIDPQNATLFLSLRTNNLGRVETFVKVIGKNIECDFRLEDDNEVVLMRGGAQELSQLLEAHGFRLAKLSAQMTRKPADLFTVRDEREQNKAKYSFDAKA